MDPFDIRIKFSAQLEHMNASMMAAQKAASYAMKHKDLAEDLHSCILEQLAKNPMNNRANIMFFIEHLCEMAQKENYKSYPNMIQKDIVEIVDHVAPADGAGRANVKVARKVLHGLQDKSVLQGDTVKELEDVLKTRDTSTGDDVVHDSTGTPGTSSRPAGKLDKRQIEQRIEEDRERHKRLREGIWAVPSENNREYVEAMEDCSDIGSDDDLAAREMEGEREEDEEFA